MTDAKEIEAIAAQIGSRVFRDADGRIYAVEHGAHVFGGRYIWSLIDYAEMYRAGKIK